MIFNTVYFTPEKSEYDLVTVASNENGEVILQSSFGKIKYAIFGSPAFPNGSYSYICPITKLESTNGNGQFDINVFSRFSNTISKGEYEFIGEKLSLKVMNEDNNPIEGMEINAFLFP